jgi:2-dehydro-3-deoxyphosphooctonate aldolase (KDO 8-P synthase)
MEIKNVRIRNFLVGQNQPLTVFCGPCVIEGEDFLLKTGEELKKIFSKHPFQFIFKASYDKANRSSIHSFRGPGLEKGLKILEKVRKKLDVPIISDIHAPEEAEIAAEVLDVIQIPAFLCRQTDLIAAAGKTRAAINVKKGQFLSPWDMKNVVEKLNSMGHDRIILTDRGTSFGYNNLVSDMRAIPVMKQFGFPVCFDATHSAQLPGGMGSSSGGQREFIPTLARAAIAAGVNALFIEAHPDPANAKSDKATVMPFDALRSLLVEVERLYEAMQCSSAALS